MAGHSRHHLIDYVREYKDAAACDSWSRALHCAILLRAYRCDTDTQYANALYAEGYAHEKLGDLRLAAACYDLAIRLTGHPKAARRLALVRGIAADVG